MKAGVAAAILSERKTVLESKNLQAIQNSLTSIERYLGYRCSSDYPNNRLAEIVNNWIRKSEGKFPIDQNLRLLVNFGLNN